MFLHSLSLRHFRCYSEMTLKCSPGVNVIWGPNARGKTSILEAIYFLSTGLSFRTAQRHEMVKWEEEYLSTRAVFTRHEIEQTLQIDYGRSHYEVHHNHTSYPSLAALTGVFPTVVITPDDALVKGSPSSRRQFLDLLIAQMDPLYTHHLTRYMRALKQRNQLLRFEKQPETTIWESMMAPAAAYIVQTRCNMAKKLEKKAVEIFPHLWGDKQSVQVTYPLETDDEDQLTQWFQKAWKHSLPKDRVFKATQIGPHRDDLHIALNQQPAREYGSEGQKRLLVTTLRLASWHLLKEHIQGNPLLLIDDLGMHLDEKRRCAVTDYTHNLGQVFITSTEPLSFNHKAHRTHI